jgi:YfiR/HmsC-like
LGLLVGFLPITCAQGASKEASVRVAFVYNFIKFSEWPNQAASASLRLCVLGADSAAKAALTPLNGQPVITQLVDAKPVVKQSVELIFLDDPSSTLQSLKSCHILYRPARAVPIAVPDPLPLGVLLIADDPEPSEANVSIALIRSRDGRIEFAISAAAVNQAGVSISSQLFKLAKNSPGGK